MPWHKEKGHSKCPASKPWAVVKNDNGHVQGCHPSEAKANRQLAALYANTNKAIPVWLHRALK